MNNSKPANFEDLKCLDMEIIKGVPWAQSMYKKLETGFKTAFLNWIQVVLTLSQNEADVLEWTSTYTEQFQEMCCEMVSDINDLHEQVIVNIEKYLNRTEVLCKTLQIEMPVFGHQKLGLYQEQLQLRRSIKELEQTVEARQLELNEFRRKQLKLCHLLGKEPIIIKDNPLPTSHEILQLQKHIEELEQEQFKREERFFTVKEKLVELIKEIDYTPTTKFEKEVLHGDESKFALTESNMRALDNFYFDVQKRCENVKEDICLSRNKIEQLWTLLDLDFLEREQFRQKYTGNSIKVLEALKNELRRCEVLKMANIKVFIDRLKQELLELWKKCQCSESVKNEYKYFDSDCYTEDLMELHEVQIQKWQQYAEENKDTLALLNKHRTLWEQLIQLDHSTSGPDRYNNRGGKLLKEEKERRALSKQIPKLESELLVHAENYEARHGTPFLTFGQPISEYIENLHADRENARKLKLSARKAQKNVTSTPRNKSTAVIPKSSQSTFKHQGPSRRLKMSMSEPSKKRKLMGSPKVLVTTISRTKRLSTERKRIDKIRRQSRQNRGGEDNSIYSEFQHDLTRRNDLRSTLQFDVAPGTSRD